MSVILDNENCLASLFLNGYNVDTIENVNHKMNIKYIGNSKDL